MDEYFQALTELRDFLEGHGDRYCAPRLRGFVEEYKSLQERQASKSTYADHYQEVIGNIAGGMGSISDLTLSLEGGHFVDRSSIREVNRKKDKLTEILYQSAKRSLAEVSK